MIISHIHHFIFIKTNKTAGTSVEVALSSICGEEDVITPFRSENEQFRAGRGPQNYRIEHALKPRRPFWRKLLGRPQRYWHPSVGFYEHIPAWRIRDYVGEDVWRSYTKFAFDRNPWERQVSWYLYKTQSKRRRPSFERFMRSHYANVGNHELYMSGSELAVNFLGRYESLDDDLNKALALAGVDTKISLPKVNVTPKEDATRDYRSHYTPELRDVVAKWYDPEIALLGYSY